MSTNQDDILTFSAEAPAAKRCEQPWRVLIVDDEPAIHDVTRLALTGFDYNGCPLEFDSAYGEVDARRLLQSNRGYALVFLDVVMEAKDSGLRLVKFIRDEMRNQHLQIIMRTGQPGDRPEEEVVKNYAINDYKQKTELTRERLYSVVTLSLRAYDQSRSLLQLSAQLQQSNTRLAELNSSLEQQVAARTRELSDKSHRLQEMLDSNLTLMRIMAHDLNNYLLVVMANTARACKEPDLPSAKARLERVAWAAERQRDLIARVVDFEAMRVGKYALQLAPVSLASLIEQTRATFEDRMLQKNVGFGVDWHGVKDMNILVDAVAFTNSVLNNLVSNALKFSESGGKITIEVRSAGEGKVQVSIRDQGVGMPVSIMQCLFDIDKKTSRPGTNGERGTGFGMPIVKSLVEKMQGTITVESRERQEGQSDHGTTFRLVLLQAA